MMRPQAAGWFEVLVARDDVTTLLEALAATGHVELEPRVRAGLPPGIAEAQPLLARGTELAQRYAAYWPRAGLVPSPFPEAPLATLERGIARIEAWAREAEPLIAQAQRALLEREELERWATVLAALLEHRLDLAALAAAGPLVQARLIELPSNTLETFASASGVVRAVDTPEARYLIALGTADDLDALAREATALKGRVHPVPGWLGESVVASEAWIDTRRAALDREAAVREAALQELATRHELATALADLARLQWLARNVRELETDQHFAWVTGWTSDPDGARLQAALEAGHARALLRFCPAPRELRAPLLLANPPWARPFEIFPKALGMPAADEADPSVLLALTVPLMFGYMFGDLGQGLVIAALGFAYRRRHVVARLLIAGGLSAAGFGLLFGSVFAREDVIPALWMHPLSHPIELLAVPVVGGALLLAAGLLLNALASYWRGEWARWVGEDLGLLAVYGGVMGSIFHLEFAWLAAAGGAAFVAGHALHAQRASAAGAALGELVERTLQLLINTLSFARIGAFALAHAGLSSAVMALADSTGGGIAWWVVMAVGNVAIIVVEAMVVSIQTTRLVLFEFFTRFLHGGGRVFRPLPPPPLTSRET
ncbi:MAG TPA: V-type ATPase 116kDa subunit family protein [Burkholderiaceae bacterium]|nr:V-type ATPase 116kDa subunit family protein [Burkholderiaceae bacterium]